MEMLDAKTLTNPVLVLSSKYNDIELDIKTNKFLIDELYVKKFDQTSAYAELTKIPDQIISSLEQVRDMLQNGLIGSSASDDQGLSGTDGSLLNPNLAGLTEMMLDRVLGAIMPIVNIPSMIAVPPLPLVGELPVAIKKISTMGEALEDLPKEIKDKIKEEKEKNKSSSKDKFKIPPKVINTIDDISKSVDTAVDEWKMFTPTFYQACFDALLELLDPVFQFFGLIAGFPLNLINQVNTAAEQIREFAKNAYKMISDYLIDKVMEPINAVKFLANGTISTDYIISALELKNIKKKAELSANVLEADVEKNKMAVKKAEERKKIYDKMLTKITNTISSDNEENLKNASPETIKAYRKITEEQIKKCKEFGNGNLDELSASLVIAEENLKKFREISADIVANLSKQIVIKPRPEGKAPADVADT